MRAVLAEEGEARKDGGEPQAADGPLRRRRHRQTDAVAEAGDDKAHRQGKARRSDTTLRNFIRSAPKAKMTKLSIISAAPTCGAHMTKAMRSVQFATICSMTMWWSRRRSGKSLSRMKWKAVQTSRPQARNTGGMLQGRAPARHKPSRNAVSTA